METSFFARDTAEVAEDLLGCRLVKETGAETLRGRIVEAEAYYGDHVEDPASHAQGGVTDRNKVMFEKPGRAYVYICYGIHTMFNITTEEEGRAGAVLIRALEPLEGLDRMREVRGNFEKSELCNGPGKLCQAFQIEKAHNREEITEGSLRVEEGDEPESVVSSSRIGISQGEDLELRFHVEGSRFVSER
ncbi:MAG: DNA-3-methyladenine glycosylase [Candidatus Nanohaloarchaea archaeon]|nr:DNA-3-methyladenine glycosylase [Candidatus Nanohaloarchaea archaeon]